jgi:hypothetical protein
MFTHEGERRYNLHDKVCGKSAGILAEGEGQSFDFFFFGRYER